MSVERLTYSLTGELPVTSWHRSQDKMCSLFFTSACTVDRLLMHQISPKAPKCSGIFSRDTTKCGPPRYSLEELAGHEQRLRQIAPQGHGERCDLLLPELLNVVLLPMTGSLLGKHARQVLGKVAAGKQCPLS